MRNPVDKILRLVVIGLAALVLVQLIRAGFRANPLAWVKIPPVPMLETNSPPPSESVPSPKNSTASPAKISNTNAPKPTLVETNLSKAKTIPASQTNAEPVTLAATNTNSNATQTVSSAGTNLVETPTNSTKAGTNAVEVKPAIENGTNHLSLADTNQMVAAKPLKDPQVSPRPGMPMPGGMSFSGFPGIPGRPGSSPKLPPDVQQRLDKIVDSEILAPVMRPLPAGLLGIAGDTAFLRTATGQTGLAKVGESVGEMKLLIIGTNRVLIEQAGQKKELMIFNGYGGASLMPTNNESSK